MSIRYYKNKDIYSASLSKVYHNYGAQPASLAYGAQPVYEQTKQQLLATPNRYKLVDNKSSAGFAGEVDNEKKEKSQSVTIEYKILQSASTSNPSVWGAAFWFSLHNGAAHYPQNPSKIWQSRMISFIKGIPMMLPCEKCANHAIAYIESRSDELPNIVKTQKNLFKFFVEFHNFVNKKLNKVQFSLDQARKIFLEPKNVITLKFS